VYRLLREALPHHVILAKLPLVRFTQPTDPTEVRYWYGLLGGLQVGFAICSPSGRVLAVIDMESERGSSRRTMQIKQSVLAACRVRYLRCTGDELPSVAELQLLVPQPQGSTREPMATQAWGSATAPPPTGPRADPARQTLWRDSGFLQDSFLAPAGDLGTPGAGPPGLTVRELPAEDTGTGGVIIDTPPSPSPPLRH
jgi:hypothetical protein